MLHIELSRNEAENTLQANILPFYTPMTPRWVKRSKHFIFFKYMYVMSHIKLKGKTCRTLYKFDLMHTPEIIGWVKRSDIEIVQKSIFGLNLVNWLSLIMV